MTIFSVQSTLFTRASVALLSSNGLKRFSFASSFSSSALYSPPLPKTKKRRFPIVSAVDIGGVTVARNDDDPTNNVPDSIFSKLGMQLSTTTSSPITLIVTTKQNFDHVQVPGDHVNRSLNDTHVLCRFLNCFEMSYKCSPSRAVEERS